MHTATILSLNVSIKGGVYPSYTNSRIVLYSMVEYIIRFFSCEECRLHFSEMVTTLRHSLLNYDGDSILWLWEVHNKVNKRLKDSVSNDPSYPKALFPSYEVCPYCYQRVTTSTDIPNWNNVVVKDSFFPSITTHETVFIWNKTAVFLFLCNFYGKGHFNNISHEALVRIGWPTKYSTNLFVPHTPTILSSFSILVYLLLTAVGLACLLNLKLKRTRFKSL